MNSAPPDVGPAEHPKVIPGIRCHLLFERPEGRSTWIVGVSDLDRYLVLPQALCSPIMYAIERLDGTRAPETIQAEVREEFQQDLPIGDLLTRLRKARLLVGNEADVRPPITNSGLLALDLFSIPFRSRAQVGRVHHVVSAVWFVTLALGILGGGTLAITKAPALPSPALTLSTLLWVVTLSIAVHELSHVFAALAVGIRVRKVTFALFLAYIPMIYLTIPGIYTIPPRQRVWIWSAGCVANLSIGLSAWGLLAVTEPPMHGPLALTAFVNLALVKINLIPFLPTDGYFILSTLLKEQNVRRRAFATLLDWIRGRRGSEQFLVLAYALVSVALMLRLLVRAPVPLLASAALGASVVLLVSMYRRA